MPVVAWVPLFIKSEPLHGQEKIEPCQGLADIWPGKWFFLVQDILHSCKHGPGGGVAVHVGGIGFPVKHAPEPLDKVL